MPNYMIVNQLKNVYLAVTDSTPTSGSEVKMLVIGAPQSSTVAAFWNIAAVSGGYQISLASNPNLYLDIDATSAENVKNGTRLLVAATAKFFNSNLWTVGQLAAPSLGKPNQIESEATAGDFVIDAGDWPASKVYQDENNTNQQWQILSVR